MLRFANLRLLHLRHQKIKNSSTGGSQFSKSQVWFHLRDAQEPCFPHLNDCLPEGMTLISLLSLASVTSGAEESLITCSN